MKIILIITILCFNSISFSAEKREVSAEEMNTFLEAIKEKEDEELLIGSPQFTDCKEQLDAFKAKSGGDEKKALQNCVTTKLIGEDGDENAAGKLAEISEKLGLESFNKEAARSSKSIRDYLSERLETAIYGEDVVNAKKQKAFKDQKFVNHEIYYKLYAEQIGKNTLLQVSRYCLENFGGANPTDLLVVQSKSKTQLPGSQGIGFISIGEIDPDVEAVPGGFVAKKLNIPVLVSKLELKTDLQGDKQFWLAQQTSVREYQVCNSKNKNVCEGKFPQGSASVRKYRTVDELALIKQAEFELSKDDGAKTLIKDKYRFCASQVIKNMCEVYRCKNVYNASTPEVEQKRCREDLGSPVAGAAEKTADQIATESVENQFKGSVELGADDRDEDNTRGFIACNLKTRLQEYRTILKAVKGIQEDNKDSVNNSGFNLAAGQLFQAKGKNSIDNLTSIGSQELVQNVDTLKNSEADAKALQEKCMNPVEGDPGAFELIEGADKNEACKVLISEIDEAKFNIIKLDTEAKANLRLKEINAAESAESLKEFLKKNNMDEYIGRLNELGDAGLDEIKALISQDFKAKRLSLVDSLNAKFKSQQKIRVGQDDNDTIKTNNKDLRNAVANQTIGDIEQHKKRVETLFEYSNIVSSFLEITDKPGGEGKVVATSSTGRAKELGSSTNGLDNYFSTDEAESSAEGDVNYLGALSQFISFKEDPQVDEEGNTPGPQNDNDSQ